MITGIDINQRIEFTLSFDTSEPKTIFILRPLSASELMEFSINKEMKEITKIFMMIEKCIVEIKNYKIGEKIINISDENEKRDIIKSLPVNVINELSIKLTEINHLTDIERKNS